MSARYPIPVTATQVGTYFVGQYYKVMEQQPDYAYQFYSDASTMLRVQGSSTGSAAGLLQIHALIMSLKYTGFEVRTAHALESWSGGVLVMVSGSVVVKEFSSRRKFVETFFLAPQEKGYFVLNDVFHFIDDDMLSLHPGDMLPQKSFDPKLSCPISEPGYLLHGQVVTTLPELEVALNSQTNGHYNAPSMQQQVTEITSNSWDMNSGLDGDTSLQMSKHDRLLNAIEHSSEEPVKHTYASVLLATSSQPTAVSLDYSKKEFTDLERNHSLQNALHQDTVPIDLCETSAAEAPDEDDYEIRSVYVRKVPSDASESDIEEEFRKFGNIAADGVVIRSRKDVGVCYAFVEFEEMAGVHNAVKAGHAMVAGCQVFIESRRPNSNIPSRLTKGRARVRSSVHFNASRGRNSSRTTGRGAALDAGSREHCKLRGNGYLIGPIPRQENDHSGNHMTSLQEELGKGLLLS